jgi:hypothetical protein
VGLVALLGGVLAAAAPGAGPQRPQQSIRPGDPQEHRDFQPQRDRDRDRGQQQQVRPIDSLDEWRKADAELTAAGARFAILTDEREEISKEMARENSRYNPGSVHPRQFIRGRTLLQLMTKWDEKTAERGRESRRAFDIAYRAHASREALGEMLRDRERQLERERRLNDAERHELGRARRWLSAMPRESAAWVGRFVLEIYPVELGTLIVTRLSSGGRGGPRGGRRGGPPPRPTLESLPPNEHKEFLEDQIERILRDIENRKNEVESLQERIKALDEQIKQAGRTPTPTPTPAPTPAPQSALTIALASASLRFGPTHIMPEPTP